ncbi:MAG: hypothetical protein ACYCU7_12200 [Acidimicrobiales bacterium]
MRARLAVGIVTSLGALSTGGVALSAAAGVSTAHRSDPSHSTTAPARLVGTALHQLQGEEGSLSAQIATVRQSLTKAAQDEQAKIAQADQALATREAALAQQEQQLAAQEAAVRQEAAQLAAQSAAGTSAPASHGDEGGGDD